MIDRLVVSSMSLPDDNIVVAVLGLEDLGATQAARLLGIFCSVGYIVGTGERSCGSHPERIRDVQLQ